MDTGKEDIMDNRKIIFVQCEDSDVKPISDILGTIGNTGYYFIIVSPTAKALRREDIEAYHRMLSEVLERTGTPVTRRPAVTEQEIVRDDEDDKPFC